MTLPNPTSPTRVAITGASGAYGRTLLAQLRDVPDMTAAVLVDPDGDGARRTVDELGISGSTVVAGIDGVDWADVDVLVEATGNVVAGIAYASAAIEAGTSVVMVSKEVETVAGVALAERASAAGVRYLPGAGDQPANLLRLVSWVERVGLEIVAVGKSSEYDLAFDPEAGRSPSSTSPSTHRRSGPSSRSTTDRVACARRSTPVPRPSRRSGVAPPPTTAR
ncbi:hypothetical protein P9139_08355 [Curtobacterium flaccumfaciens]|nr:hypothetical protein P9139_08355 [Curtobacterium flaccumfaciens]